jgi:sarcosine oxidase subunit gamma
LKLICAAALTTAPAHQAVDGIGMLSWAWVERPSHAAQSARRQRNPAFVNGVRPPRGWTSVQANRFTASGDRACLWLGPDEWLIVGPDGQGEDLVRELRAALAGQHAAVTDVSEARTSILVQGPRARDLLQKGFPLDLHPREFQSGHCAQSHIAGANIILRQLDDAPSYEVLVLNSFAEHLWLWMESAAREYKTVVLA